MTSQIVSSTIDEDFPIAGQDNDSLGFRNNFNIIKTGLATANSEITVLQNIGIFKSPLNEDTTLNNDFNGELIYNVKTNRTVGVTYETSSTSPITTINFEDAEYHIISMTGEHVLRIEEWPNIDDAVAKIRIAVKTNGEENTISLGNLVIGKPYTIFSLGTTTQSQWNVIAGTAGVTYNVGSIFIAANSGTGLGDGVTKQNWVVSFITQGGDIVSLEGGIQSFAISTDLSVIQVFDLWTSDKGNTVYLQRISRSVESTLVIDTLEQIGNVSLTNLQAGEVLKYNGTDWVNDTDATSGGGGTSNSFETIAVAGQTSVVADSSTDTLTLVAGTGITITTVAATDTITIASSISSGATAFTGLSDISTAGLTVDRIYLPAMTMLDVTANGTTAYRFDQYSSTDNPTIYAISGTTIAFNLAGASGHPFLIRFSGANYSTGLVHVTTDGTVSTGSSAQAKQSGTLYWKIPYGISGTYGYLCQNHGGMIGSIIIKDISAI